MDSDEEFLQFAEAEEAPPSPVPRKKLKRLRRKLTSPKASEEAVPHRSGEEDTPSPPSRPESFPSLFETLDSEERDDEDGFQATKSRSVFDFMRPKEGAEMDHATDSSGKNGRVAGVKRSLDFGSDGEELDGGDRDRATASVGVDEEIGESRMEESEKELPDFDGAEGKKEKTTKKHKKKKKKDKGSDGGGDEEPSSGGKKDRKTRLKELRVESQRLLRETRDASFKPQPLVQKPVSSVLEKIRQRRLELSKRSSVRVSRTSFDGNDATQKELSVDLDFVDAHFEDIEYPNIAKSDAVKSLEKPADMAEKDDVEGGEGSKDTASPSSRSSAPEIVPSEEPKQTFQAPLDDTQDLFDSQTSDSKDELLDETPSSPLEEVLAPSLLAKNLKFDSACPHDSSGLLVDKVWSQIEEEVLAPSLLAMNLKFDSVCPHDSSSDEEEDNDKENVDPRRSESIDLSLSPKGDPMKAFIDEEAEEEDDSDNDLHRFQDDEDDNDDDLDLEEINDIIATGFTEKPIDDEMRTELHQKWLEQQDAAGTEHLMKKLNRGGGSGGSKQKEPRLLDEREEDEESNWEGGDFLDEAAEGPTTRNVFKMHLKKAKEMIPLMFTDHNDVYVSSDDEETERSLVQQRMFVNPEEAPFVSPTEDETSMEIFSRIKKLNPVPDSRKKPKITSHFQLLSIGGNKAKSKSSFLHRSKNPQQTFQKQGSSSSILRSFIFERDDSNSKNTVSSSDDPSDPVHVEPKPRRATAKFMNPSQARSSSQQSTQAGSSNVDGPSLHEILRASRRRPSPADDAASCHQVESTIYTAFKLDRSLTTRTAAAGSVPVRMV